MSWIVYVRENPNLKWWGWGAPMEPRWEGFMPDSWSWPEDEGPYTTTWTLREVPGASADFGRSVGRSQWETP